MSQWNNGHAFNDQYQNSDTWNGELNSQQYVNHSPNYYTDRQEYEQQHQGGPYVSFNEFISQMQSGGPTPNNTNYLNKQYSANHYNNYANMPSTSQSNPPLETLNYDVNASGNVPNGSEPYHPDLQPQYKPEDAPEGSNYTGDVAFKSNLTATATEFVPKATTSKQSANPRQQQLDPQQCMASANGYYSRKNNSASEKNWRERPSNTNLNEKPNTQIHNSYDPSPRNLEYNSRNQDQNTRNQDSNFRNQELKPRNRDRNHEFSPRTQETNAQIGSRYQEPKDSSKNQVKLNPKSRSKQPDDGRTFYNSSASKSTQDVRFGRGEGSSGKLDGRKNWVGSQRLRPTERNYVDDEQFASNYHQYREEKNERMSKVQGASSPMRSSKNKHFPNNSDDRGKLNPYVIVILYNKTSDNLTVAKHT